ncbi:MAG TPA: FecR domain-containing protein [Puia sp.]|nr:FecR domain-containing protein [Puia sp.]
MLKSAPGVEDLLCDETFLSWYFKTDPRAIQRWEQWIADHPESSHRVQQAVDFLSELILQEKTPTREQITRSERLLLERIRKVRQVRKSHAAGPAPVISYRKKAWIAAASILLLAAATVTLYTTRKRPEFHTAYGEVRSNSLPDGTEVVVNADSRIRYSTGWTDGRDREVWLTGEAFFHVRKTPFKSRFIVHARHFDVIVTGTQFNVISREEKDNVLLKEGSVLLHTANGEDLPMKPGDFVEYNDHRLTKKIVKMDSVTAWKEHKLFLDATSLKEVAAIIKEQYGITVRLEGATIEHEIVSGIMPNDNLDVLLKALEATAEFKIVRRDDEIRIIQN